MESQEFSAGSIHPAEIPVKEIDALRSIRDFTNQLFEEECQSFGGPFRYRENAAQLINDAFREKRKQVASSLVQDNRLLRRGIEREVCQDVIDYRNRQMERLIRYIEKQPIWKTKFSTSINIGNNYAIEDFSQLISALEKSEEVDKKDNFAGQTQDSIYYVSRSGMCLRLKKTLLLPSPYQGYEDEHNYNILKVLQSPTDLFLCHNDISPNHVEYEEGTMEASLEDVSFQPKLGYRVEEFLTEDFLNHQEGDFKPKIKIITRGNKLTVKDFDHNHAGHLINKIYF